MKLYEFLFPSLMMLILLCSNGCRLEYTFESKPAGTSEQTEEASEEAGYQDLDQWPNGFEVVEEVGNGWVIFKWERDGVVRWYMGRYIADSSYQIRRSYASISQTLIEIPPPTPQ